MMGLYYNRSGQPITAEQWSIAFRDENVKRVAFDQITEGLSVSTVWLGLNHRYGAGPPLIFETMVFGGDEDEYCERYSTESEALAGHARIVSAVRDGKHPRE